VRAWLLLGALLALSVGAVLTAARTGGSIAGRPGFRRADLRRQLAARADAGAALAPLPFGSGGGCAP
jgi:hypothetical protein